MVALAGVVSTSTAFPLPLRIERTSPGRGRLIAPFEFLSPTLGLIQVEAGFETDYASVPRLFWLLYPPDGAYTPAAVVHDWLYARQAVAGRRLTRSEADRVFFEAMTALGVPWLRRHLLHRAVRLGGWAAWRQESAQNDHRRETT